MKTEFRLLWILGLGLFTFPLLQAQTVLEAEDAYFSSGEVATEHPGYTGSGFVDTENRSGEYLEWFFNATAGATGDIDFRYALGKDEHRYMEIYVNEVLIDTIDFDNTGAFTTYIYKSVPATLNEGVNRVKAVAINPEGAPNMDHLRIIPDTADLPYCTIELQSAGNGTVSLDPVADSFLVGTIITATATPNPGFSFSGWTGSMESNRNPLVIPAVEGISLTANFENALPAFPGAEGFAKNITGGRGGIVYQVTNLDNDGPGSLRAGVEMSGPRIIVFRVSGTIRLGSTLRISNPDITIAGQTAPGDGITLADFPLMVDADNVVIRFLRARLGDIYQLESDAFSCHDQSGVIIDHCSFSWGIDEVASFYSNTEFIMQWCMITESLWDSYHSKGEHGYGGIWGGDHASMHHNLLAHHTSRTPRFNGARYNAGWNEHVDYRNNVNYNWGFNSAYGAEPSDIDGNKASYNIVGNYIKYGPATGGGVKSRIIKPDEQTEVPDAGYSYFYVDGNYVWDYPAVTEDNWAGGVAINTPLIPEIKLDEPIEYDTITEWPAEIAFEHVLAWSGCVLPNRDPIDRRIVDEVITGTATYGGNYGEKRGIIDSQDDVGGWPELNSTTPPVDTDGDGMPDDWETANGLNPNDPEDRNGDIRANGYTNIEDYLNDLVAGYTYLIRPLNFMISGNTETEVSLSWEDITDNEDGFLLEKAVRDGEFVQIAEIGPNTTSYTDAIESLDTLTYRLRAFNGTDTSLYTDVAKLEPVIDALNEQVIGSASIEIYPNPFDEGFVARFRMLRSGSVNITLKDFTGRDVYQMHNGLLGEGWHDLHFSESLSSGVYFVTIQTSSETLIIKIVRM